MCDRTASIARVVGLPPPEVPPGMLEESCAFSAWIRVMSASARVGVPSSLNIV